MRMFSLLLALFLMGSMLFGCATRTRRVNAVSIRKNDKHLIVSLPRIRQ